jgi:hypothetical protein
MLITGIGYQQCVTNEARSFPFLPSLELYQAMKQTERLYGFSHSLNKTIELFIHYREMQNPGLIFSSCSRFRMVFFTPKSLQ